MLEIDGSMGEGGGQVLRTALSLSAVLGKPVKIGSIRSGRSPPGLKPQHLAVCNALAEISGAKLEGAKIGSTQIAFEPGKVRGGKFEFGIGTAGSCMLFLQALLPVLLHAGEGSEVLVEGGTHVQGAPTFEYLANVFLPAIALMGANASAKMVRAGFYPAGNGAVALSCSPSSFSGVEFTRREGEEVHYSIIHSGLPEHVAKREEQAVLAAFPFAKGSAKGAQAACPGNAVTLWRGFFGASSLGQRGRKAEEVAREACETLFLDMKSGASVDGNLSDQLLLYAAFAGGRTRYRVPGFTAHLETNAMVVRAMTGRNIMLDPEDRMVEVS